MLRTLYLAITNSMLLILKLVVKTAWFSHCTLSYKQVALLCFVVQTPWSPKCILLYSSMVLNKCVCKHLVTSTAKYCMFGGASSLYLCEQQSCTSGNSGSWVSVCCHPQRNSLPCMSHWNCKRGCDVLHPYNDHIVIWLYSTADQKHLPNVEARFHCPQAFLSSDFQCRDDVSVLK